MNSTEAGFLHAILDAPDDDDVRLIFADWLLERGDPHGEFIQVQVQLAKLTEDAPQRKALDARQAALLAAHEDEWIGLVKKFAKHHRFARGFLDFINIDADTLLTHAEEMLAW